MNIKWDQVGQKDRPIQDTQKAYLEMTTTSWGNGPIQVPMLPMGPQPTPYIITGNGQGSR